MAQRVKCWTCGRRIDPDTEDCRHCGAMLLTLCEACGATGTVYADRCAGCGVELTPRSYQAHLPWGRIVAVLLLLLLAGGATGFFLTKKDRTDRRWQTLRDATDDYAAGRHQEATVRLRHLLDRWPDEHRAHHLLALNYLALARLADARRHAERALDLAPERVEPHIVLAVCEFEAGHLGAARDHARRILSHTGSVELTTLQARAHLIVGKVHTTSDFLDLRRAHHHLHAALDSGRFDDPEAWLMLAEISLAYESAGIRLATRGGADHYLSRARAVARQRLEADPGHVDTLFLLARIDGMEGNHEAARNRIRDVPSTRPGHRILRARIDGQLGLQAEAIRELDAVLADADDPAVVLAVADAYSACGEAERARTAERTALEKYPSDVRVIHREVRRLIAEGRAAEARALGEAGLLHHPGNDLLVVACGDALAAEPGRRDDAEAHLREHGKGPNSEATLRLADRLLDTPPGDPRYRVRIDEAERLMTLDDPDAADLFPVYRLFLRGKLALRRRDPDRAAEVLTELTERAPTDPAVRRLLAAAHGLRREYELQARELGSLIEIQGPHPEILLERSEAWLRAGFLRNALADARAVRSERPRWTGAVLLLARILVIEDEGLTARATQLLSSVADDVDDPVRIRIHLGLMLARSGNTADAERVLREARRHAKTPDEQLEVTDALAQWRASQGGDQARDRSRRIWLEYLDQHPDSVAGPLAFATTLIDSGDAESARPWIGKVLEKDPRNLVALRLSFECDLGATPDLEAAADTAQRIRDIAPKSVTDVYARGRLALARKNPKGAQPLLSEATRRDPDDPRAAFFFALASAAVGNHGDAAAALDRALELEPRLRTARELLADIHLDWAEELIEAGQPSQAADLLSRSLAHDPDDFRLRALLAKALYHAGFRENASLLIRARSICERLLPDLEEAGPDTSRAFLGPTRQLHAAILMAQREWELAGHAFRRHLELSPEDARSLHSLGICLLRQGEPAAALEPLRRAGELNPDRLDTLLVLLDALSELGRDEEARRLVDERIAARPEDSATRTALARLLLQSGQVKAAERILREALEREPGHLAAAGEFVELLVRSGRSEEAVRFVRGLLAADRSPADLNVLLARALLATRPDSAEAEKRLRSALAAGLQKDDLYLRGLNLLLLILLRTDRHAEAAPLEADYSSWLREKKVVFAGSDLTTRAAYAWYFLGQARDAADQSSRAEHCYRRAIDMKPDFGRALNNLADLVSRSAAGYEEPRRSDRLTEARQLASRAIELLPGEPEPMDTLGGILLLQGRPEAALARFTAAVAAARERPDPPAGLMARLLLSVARAQCALDRRDDARRTLARVLALAPELEGDPDYESVASRLR